MSKRVSHSYLDPWIGPRIKAIYPYLHIPKRFLPEGIIAVGHALAIVGAVGFVFSTEHWWGGLLIAIGALGNHIADCIDGTHARATGQCRNGGELLDHFTDPLSFAYWIVGWSLSCDASLLGMAGLICVYATALLTSIRAKMVGEFTLSSFGPTEFKILLALYGIVLMLLPESSRITDGVASQIAFTFFSVMLVFGIMQLLLTLISAVQDVNTRGAAPDTSAWVTRDKDEPRNEFLAATKASRDVVA